MNPTSFGSLVGGFFIGVAARFPRLRHRVGEGSALLGNFVLVFTHLFEAA